MVASQRHAPLAGVLAAGITGAIAGDAVGYLVGRRWGRRVLDSTLGRFVKAKHLDRAERALALRGSWAVFAGRFTVALRVMIPGLAGMAKVPYLRFALANVSGGFLWAGAMVIAGYLAGRSWRTVEHYISALGIGATIVVIGLLLVGRVVRRRRTGHDASDAPEDAPDGPDIAGPMADAEQKRSGTHASRASGVSA